MSAPGPRPVAAVTQPGRGVALALLAASLWGVSGAVAAGAFDELSPLRVAQGRFTVAALVLVPYAVWKGAIPPRGTRLAATVFGINVAVLTGVFYTSLDRLGVGPGATIEFLGPILVLLWMKYRQGRAVSGVVWISGALALAGTALLTRAWDSSALDPLGLAAGLASMVLFASYLLAGEALTARITPLAAVAWGSGVAAVFWLLALPLWQQTSSFSSGVWATLVWVGVAGTALPFISELAALRHVSSGIVGVIATAEPLIAAAAAWVLLEQALRPLQVVGALLVVGAVASVQRWGLPDVEVPFEAGR